MDNTKQKTLDSLLKRRHIVRALLENRRLLSQRSEPSVPENPDLHRSSRSFGQNSSSDESNNIIEDSDTEMQPGKIPKKTHNENIIINSSSDGDINTSMISLPRSQKSFFGDNVGSLIPPKSPFKNNVNHHNKINIISMEVIKQADSLPTSELPSLNINLLPANSVAALYEKVCSVPTAESPSLNVNLLPNDDYAAPPKVASMPTAESPSLIANLLPNDDYVTQTEVTSVPTAESPCINVYLLPQDEYAAQTEVYSVPTTSVVSSLELSPLAPFHDDMQPGPSNPSKSTPLSYTSGTTHAIAEGRTKRTHKTSSFKKSCIDFLSDEEVLDFSGASSDDWTCNESESSGSPENKKKKRDKQKKVPKDDTCKNIIRNKEKSINKRKERKKLKDAGKTYETKEGTVKEKSMGENPCEHDKCKRGCFNITEDRRKSLFNFFWSIDLQRRRDWLINCTRLVPVARKRTDSPSSRRSLTYEYYINNGEDRQKVCQKFLLQTLNVTQKYLLYNLSHSKEGMSQNDQRTRTIPDKYSPEAKAHARSFIEKLPAVPSHYNRKRTSKVYLPQELKNVSNLYRLYLKECEEKNEEAIGDAVFRNIFNNEYNISFHSPKKDKCLLCTRADRQEITSEADKTNLQNHLNEKKSTYKRFIAHQNLNTHYSDTLTTSFDLQKVLTTPHGDSMLLGYARKYAVFNFTTYESGSQNANCYIWGECDGKRGRQEIATCLFKYFQEVDGRKIRRLILYCDSCTGQNKNKVVLSTTNYYLKKSIHLETIQLNFLLPGHTYMPVDSVHATIERELKKITVWSPSQWMPYISSARKRPRPYRVIVMEHSDFISWDELATKTFTNDTLKKMQFKNIRIATFKKKSTDQIEIKYSMDEKAPVQKVALFEESEKRQKAKGKGKSRGKGTAKGKSCVNAKTNDCHAEGSKDFELHNLYNTRLPISTAKYNDSKLLCVNHTIPRPYQQEFLSLPHYKAIQDKLLQTDEEDDGEETE